MIPTVCKDGFIVNEIELYVDTCKSYNRTSCNFPCDLRTGHCHLLSVEYDVMCHQYRFSEPHPTPPPPTPSHMETGTIIGLVIATMIGTFIIMGIGYILWSKCGPRAHARLAFDEEDPMMDENTPIVRRRSSGRSRGRGDGYESIRLVEPTMVLVDAAVEHNATFEQDIVPIEQDSPEAGRDTTDDQHLIGYYSCVQRRRDELYHL
jgi:hypothetical protein